MEKKLNFLRSYFEVITVKDFCAKYGLSYETIRRTLTGENALSQKTFDNVMAATRQFEKDQAALKDNFYNGEE